MRLKDPNFKLKNKSKSMNRHLKKRQKRGREIAKKKTIAGLKEKVEKLENANATLEQSNLDYMKVIQEKKDIIERLEKEYDQLKERLVHDCNLSINAYQLGQEKINLEDHIHALIMEKEHILKENQELKKFKEKIANKNRMKDFICYNDELEKVNSIDNEQERFEALNDFCLKLQEIDSREMKIEFLKKWYNILKWSKILKERSRMNNG